MWLKQGKRYTPLGRWIDSKMSEGCRHLRAPKDSQDKTRKGEQVWQILTQFEYSNFTSISMYLYMNQASLFIVP